MTDKEKLALFLETCDGDLEEIISNYIIKYRSEFDSTRLYCLAGIINQHLLKHIMADTKALEIAQERAIYLSNYLSGKMYSTEEAELANRPIQLKNAQAIVDAIASRKEV